LDIIEHLDKYKIDLILKLMEYKYVYISSMDILRELVSFYYGFKLRILEGDKYSHVHGYPIRKSLNSGLKLKFRKL
jgi:hypothetical protein